MHVASTKVSANKPSPSELARLFDTALKTSALDSSGGGGQGRGGPGLALGRGGAFSEAYGQQAMADMAMAPEAAFAMPLMSMAARAPAAAPAPMRRMAKRAGGPPPPSDDRMMEMREEMAQEQLFSGPGRTKEMVERGYWQEGPSQGLAPPSSFWIAFAEYLRSAGGDVEPSFLCKDWLVACNGVAEALLVLGCMDFPSQGEAAVTYSAASITVTATSGPVVLFSTQIT